MTLLTAVLVQIVMFFSDDGEVVVYVCVCLCECVWGHKRVGCWRGLTRWLGEVRESL